MHKKKVRKSLPRALSPLNEPHDIRPKPDMKVFAKRLQSDFILVKIPGNQYNIHRDILLEQSEYFKGWARSGSRQLEDSVDLIWSPRFHFHDAFTSFLKFLYTDTFTGPVFQSEQENCIHAAHLYVLADYLSVDRLKELALTEFRRTLEGKVVEPESPEEPQWGLGEKSMIIKGLVLESTAIDLICDVLYGNPFDIVTDAMNQGASSTSVNETRTLIDVESGSGLDPNGPTDIVQNENNNNGTLLRTVGDLNESFVDARTAGRKSFSAYIAEDMKRLMEAKEAKHLLAGRDDFVLDILEHLFGTS